MKKANRILVIAALLLIGFSANAQRHRGSDRMGEFYFGFDAVAPLGEFNKAADAIGAGYPVYPLDGDHVGTSASMGIGFSFKYSFTFSIIDDQCSAGPFVGIDLAWNNLDKKVRNVFNDVKADKPNYINMPIMVGANGRYYFNDIFGVSAEFGIGADMLYITPQGWSDVKQKYGTDFSMAWQVGAGVYFGRHVNLGIHYYSFGTHNTVETDVKNYTKYMGALMFKLGFCW
ncbi:MAG: hypothetical protein IJP95_09455 [Bacteroidales bacterium]|nr:hypothetical protein [Bacteroidales bacterium]